MSDTSFAQANQRAMLRAYLKAQAAHKSIHKLTRAFEQDSSDEEIANRLAEAKRLLYQVEQLIKS